MRWRKLLFDDDTAMAWTTWTSADEAEAPEFDPPFGSGLVNLQRGGSVVTSEQRSGSLVDAERG